MYKYVYICIYTYIYICITCICTHMYGVVGVFTVHQPASRDWALFDRVLVLDAGTVLHVPYSVSHTCHVRYMRH